MKSGENGLGWYVKNNLEPLLAAVRTSRTIRTNLVKAKIDKSQKDTLCKKATESIDHVVSGCSKLTLKEYNFKYIGNLLESGILKIEISGLNTSQKVF